ncbi:hypothetical protein AtEden1_Chr2g0245681 [Arabidopsis thaliana]
MKLFTTALFVIAFGIILYFVCRMPFLYCVDKSPEKPSSLHSLRDSGIATPHKAIDDLKGIYGNHQIFEALREYHPDLVKQPRYLATITVGYNQRHNIDACVSKFSENFTIVLFHYDGVTSAWNDEFEWSRNAIHISVKKQTKWWYAKRFLHSDIVALYDYIFIWDEDLGVDHFNAEEYIHIVKKHGLEISQPGLDP